MTNSNVSIESYILEGALMTEEYLSSLSLKTLRAIFKFKGLQQLGFYKWNKVDTVGYLTRYFKPLNPTTQTWASEDETLTTESTEPTMEEINEATTMTNAPKLRKPILRPTTHAAPSAFEAKTTILRRLEREIYNLTGITGNVSCGMIDYQSGTVQLNDGVLTTPRGLSLKLKQAIQEINEGW